MKASELMIGDWVYAIDDNGEKHPCRVNNPQYDYINKRDDFCVDFYGTGYDPEWPDVTFNVEPIPLTPEILEKNGFECRGAWCLPGEDLGLRQDGDSWGLLSYYAEYDALAFCHIKYVHELQKALRLCGIDKTIEL